MKTKILTSVLFVSFLVFISCTPKTVENNDQALADSLLQININAYNSGDAKTIADMFTDDALMIGNGKYNWTKDSILAWAKTVAPFIKNFQGYLGPSTVTTDMIFMQKYWTLDFVVEGNSMPAKGVSILVWKKQPDSSWKTVLENSDYDIKMY